MSARPGNSLPAHNAEQRASVRDHLANERTLLAWVRTAITIIGLGFIVGRLVTSAGAGTGWAIAVGAILVLAGAATVLAGLRRFVTVEREIELESYRPEPLVHIILSGSVVLMALLILGYLLLVPALEL
ncbi:MAG: YidH family protein [Candidatus Limnocylindria bacterium]